MKLFEHKIIAVAIAFASLFATVGPVFAESVYIQNTVSSYANSGKDGADGEDGEDGADGKSGSSGQTVISGSGSASVKIKTTVNGETIVDIDETHSGDGTVSTSSTTEVIGDAKVAVELSDEERANIFRLLEQIRLILISYVSQLFN